MAQCVVHGFEDVQVDEHHGGGRPDGTGRGDRVLGPVLELLPVQEASARVVGGQAPQLVLKLALAGHVPESEHQATHAPALPVAGPVGRRLGGVLARAGKPGRIIPWRWPAHIQNVKRSGA